jgi:hypothetical protein
VAEAGTRIEFTGSHTLQAGASLTGAGGYRIGAPTTEGRVSIADSLSVQSNWILLNGVLEGAGGGHLKGSGKLSWQGGSIQGDLSVDSGFNVELTGAGAKTLHGILTNAGAISWGGTGNLLVSGVSGLSNSGSLTLQGDTSLLLNPGATLLLQNAGSLKKAGGTGKSVIAASNPVQNSGAVEVDSGTLSFQAPSFVQTAGSVALLHSTLEVVQGGSPALLDLQGGTLGGVGTVNANVTNRATVHPSSADFTGGLVVNGGYQQTAGGTTLLDVGPGPDHPPFNSLQVNGNADLSGALSVQGTAGFSPAFGAQLTNAVTYASHTGQLTTGFAQNLDAGRIFRPSAGSGVDVLFGAAAPLNLGANATTVAGDVSVFFPQAFQNGALTVFPVVDTNSLPQTGLPANSLIRDVSADASFGGPARVCLPIPPGFQGSAQLYHLEGSVWVNRTVQAQTQGAVCAESATLGLFAEGGAGFLQGDVNGDGRVTVQDATLVLRAIVKLAQLTPDQVKAADMTQDGQVRVQDVNALLRRILGVG